MNSHIRVNQSHDLSGLNSEANNKTCPDGSPEEIRGVIFDLDGTLYQMKWYFRPVLALMLMPSSLRLQHYMSIRKKHMGDDRKSAAALLDAMASELARKTGEGDTMKMLVWIRSKFYPAFERAMNLVRGSRPGLNPMLRTLRERGIRLGVLSDFSRVAQRLRGLGIAPDQFDTLASTEDAGCLKPCPRPLLALAREWGVPCEKIMVIGDRQDTDGEAASLAHMHFLRISDLRVIPEGAYSWTTLKEHLLTLPGANGSAKHKPSVTNDHS
ncbi:MAG: HAD-IA family hydrolase [Chitinivibrionales bacterium]|nr:HAD-IA family hydrolase [Chitinivibrionales bacterium]